MYKTFAEFCNRAKKLKLSNWTVDFTDTNASFKLFTSPYSIPNIHVIVDSSLQFKCAVYGWILPGDHKLYKTHFRSLGNVTISQLLCNIRSYKLCDGINELICHSISCNIDLATATNPSVSNSHLSKQFRGSKECIALIPTDITSCESCLKTPQE